MENLIFDARGIEIFVKPPLKESGKNLKNAMMTSSKNRGIPEDFKYAHKLKATLTKIETVKESIDETYTWLSEIVEKFVEVEKKNKKILMNVFNDHEVVAFSPNQNTTVDSSFGNFESVDKPYMGGYYTSTKGKIFSICYQHYESQDIKRGMFFGVNWNEKCNRAAEATIISRYTEEDLENIIQKLNNEHLYGKLIASNQFWAEYGLQASEQYFGMPVGEIGQEGTYTDELWKHLQDTDGCAMIWLNSARYTYAESEYIGKSETVWTKDGVGIHWVSVIDYRVEDGQEQIAIANPGTGQVEWFDLDEFQYGISNMVLISELGE